MAEDASLDDFLDDESSEEAEAADTGASPDPTEADEAEPDATVEAEPAASDDEPATGADVEPAATTYAWSDEGTTCDDCGETVERRWQQDGELVCVECKDWERA